MEQVVEMKISEVGEACLGGSLGPRLTTHFEKYEKSHSWNLKE